MSVSTLWLADRLFAAKHLLLASGDLDEVIDGCTRALRPHRLLVRGSRPGLDTRLHHLPLGSFSLNRLCYGGDVTVAPAMPEEDNFLITLPLRGKARFHYGSQSCDLQPGCGAIVGPYRRFRFDIDGDFDQIVLRLSRQRVESLCASLTGADRVVPAHFNLLLGEIPEFWYKLLESAVCLPAFDGSARYPRLFGHLEDMIVESLLVTQPNSSSAAIAAAPGRYIPAARIRRAMAYMRERIAEPVRLDEVARHCGISLRALHAGFQRHVGVSPGRWLRAQRLESAYSALRDAAPGSVSVTDVALQWGFCHFGAFAAQFKARFGAKPSNVLAGKHTRTSEISARFR